jgi:integrase
LSPRTVEYCRAVLRRALNQAVRWGYIPRNVATFVDAPRSQRPDPQPLSPEEVRSFLAAVKDDRLLALYSVAIALGLRQGEALGLRWDDIDLRGGALSVRRQLQRIDGSLQLVDLKTARSRRTIRLPEVLVQQLTTHRSRQDEERRLAGTRWHEYGLVFTTTLGTPIDARNLVRWFHEHQERAGLRHIRFHDLRHTCATLLLVQGVHPRVVMEILGHSQISLTMDTYSHVIPTLQEDAAAKMNTLLQAGDEAAAVDG